MTIDINDLLGLPNGPARVNQRLPRTELAAPWQAVSPADARFIDKKIAAVLVAGILRPETVQVPTHRSANREITDIPVLDITLNADARPADVTRLADLVHRGMPRPVVAHLHHAAEDGELSLALTHPSKTDPAGSTSVIESAIRVPIGDVAPGALQVDRLNRTDLWALYQDLVQVAATGGRTQHTTLPVQDAIDLRRRLTSLESELAAVGRDAKRERNYQRRIELNARGRALRAEIQDVRGSLYGERNTEGDHT